MLTLRSIVAPGVVVVRWGGELPDKRLMKMCAGWGRIFTTGLTIMGVAFSVELLEWGDTFSDFLG